MKNAMCSNTRIFLPSLLKAYPTILVDRKTNLKVGIPNQNFESHKSTTIDSPDSVKGVNVFKCLTHGYSEQNLFYHIPRYTKSKLFIQNCTVYTISKFSQGLF